MRVRSTKRANFFSKFLIFLIILTTIILLIDYRTRPVVKTISEYQGREIATRVINQSVYDALSKSETNYKNLVHLSYNSNGDISSVETNVTDINKLQSEISLKINSEINKVSKSTVKIALGTLSGVTYLNEQGPILKFKIMPLGYVKSQLKSEFSEAGINQTLHKITLTVSATVTAIVPGNITNFDVTLNYIICDTVIVGNIPNGYTYITGDNRDIIPKVNDYASNKN